MTYANYKLKPCTVQAAKFWTNNQAGSIDNMNFIVNWMNKGQKQMVGWHNGTDICVRTSNGEIRATVGDWIIRNESGFFSVCKSDIFIAKYEAE